MPKKVVVCATPTSDSTRRLQQAIREIMPQMALDSVNAIDFLPDHLKLQCHNELITILLAGTADELENALKIKEFLKDSRLILIVPDSSREVVSKAHSMAPRYLSYADGDFRDVAAVLAKMVGVVA